MRDHTMTMADSLLKEEAIREEVEAQEGPTVEEVGTVASNLIITEIIEMIEMGTTIITMRRVSTTTRTSKKKWWTLNTQEQTWRKTDLKL